MLIFYYTTLLNLTQCSDLKSSTIYKTELTECVLHNVICKWACIKVSHLHCTPMERTGYCWACVLGCSGGSDFLLCRWCSQEDRIHTVFDHQSGRTPLDRYHGTDPETGTWPRQTYLDAAGEEKEICTGRTRTLAASTDAQNRFGDILRLIHRNTWLVVCISLYMKVDIYSKTFSPQVVCSTVSSTTRF